MPARKGIRLVASRRNKVLVVDDDSQVLASLRRILKGDHDVLSADCVESALPLLEEHPDISVILTDFDMPGRNGVELLLDSIELAPHAVRILTSGQAELSQFLDVIDKCKLHTFIPKPAAVDAVRLIVRRAVEHYELDLRNRRLVAQLEGEMAKEAMLRRSFQQYVPSEVIDELIEADGRLDVAGRQRSVTVLFADLRDFTAFSEKLEPAAVVSMLNRFFTAMAAPLVAHGGTIDKYIGDAILAHFGGLRADPDAAGHAVRAALAMRRALAELNLELADEGQGPLCFGVGINTGTCIIGNVGCPARMDYTVIGDAVNVAARIEGLTKKSPDTILVSAATHALLGPDFESTRRAPTSVRGRDELVEIYEILSAKDQ